MERTKGIARVGARLALNLPLRVFCRETAEYEWTEKSRLLDVNQFGAGFTLMRPVEVGRVIHLSIPLPHQLRCYDQFEPTYSVWGLVRHISVLKHESPLRFRIGVAFIGRHAPASYGEDPTHRYEPLPLKTGHSALWCLRRLPLTTQRSERRESRLIIPLEVLVETLDDTGKPLTQEYTVTERISSLGACIPSSLDVGIGRVLRISSPADGVSIFAAVRSREKGPDGITRLGLEFIGDRWPLEREPDFIYQKAS